jgi:transcription initiation factor IIE alpha subunit
MEAILKFNLDDADDRLSHKQCIKANDMAMVLWEFYHNSRKTIEYTVEHEKQSGLDAVETVFRHFYDLLEEQNIIVDELCL